MTHEEYLRTLLTNLQDLGRNHFHRHGATKADATARWIALEVWTRYEVLLGSRPLGECLWVYPQGPAEKVWNENEREESIKFRVGPRSTWRVDVFPESEYSDRLELRDVSADRSSVSSWSSVLAWFIGSMVPRGRDRWQVSVNNFWLCKPDARLVSVW